jgi:signal peptidase
MTVSPPTDDAQQPRESVVRAVRRGLAYGVLLLVLAVTAVTIVIPRLAGAVPLTVLSNSMAPTMPVGSLAVVKPTLPLDMTPERLDVMTPDQVRAAQDLSGIHPGTIVAFQPQANDPMLVVHRIRSITSTYSLKDGTHRYVLVTQGDNLRTEDEPSFDHMVRGEVWYHLPLLGYVNDKLNSGPASTPLVVGIAVVGYSIAAVYGIRALRVHPAGDARQDVASRLE